jgi:hypothetical protein
MCILNGIQFWSNMPFAYFQENPREFPYMYASVGCNKSVYEYIICDAYDKIHSNKTREAYVLSAKIEPFNLANRNIRFYQ